MRIIKKKNSRTNFIPQLQFVLKNLKFVSKSLIDERLHRSNSDRLHIVQNPNKYLTTKGHLFFSGHQRLTCIDFAIHLKKIYLIIKLNDHTKIHEFSKIFAQIRCSISSRVISKNTAIKLYIGSLKIVSASNQQPRTILIGNCFPLTKQKTLQLLLSNTASHINNLTNVLAQPPHRINRPEWQNKVKFRELSFTMGELALEMR